MKKISNYYYDIHIHSVLSSCADVLQTPNNIMNMCMLKGLNIVSICDHNSAKQYQTIDKIKDSYDFLIIYGIEITVHEGFHVLAYFENIEDVLMLDEIIDKSLDKSVMPPEEQTICDEFDEIEYQIEYYLNQKLIYTFDKIIPIIRKCHGLIVPAHINRHGTGILDFFPNFENYDIDAVEIYGKNNVETLEEKFPFITKYQYLFNSDAHDIEMINEQENIMELDDLSFESFKKWLTKERQ